MPLRAYKTYEAYQTTTALLKRAFFFARRSPAGTGGGETPVDLFLTYTSCRGGPGNGVLDRSVQIALILLFSAIEILDRCYVLVYP